MNNDSIPETIDDYISAWPEDIREKLTAMRLTIRKAAPEAQEKISYRMPAFTLKGMLLYFAAHKNHIGFYPFTTVLKAFSEELTPYHTSKGGIQFSHKDPLPLELVSRIVKFRVQENLAKAEAKASIKKPGRKGTK
jgi:uncharacterized protein YdhG (YjbR/CyaY superfamily)